MTANLAAKLDDFARRSFRDEADHDYIAARMAYRAGLLSQALWSSLQAMEKYFKYILLVNRVPNPKKRLGHDIVAARDLIHASTPLKINFIDPNCERYFKLVADVGACRYLEVSQYSMLDDLHLLDSAVWSIRRFCKPLHYVLPDGASSLDLELQAIAKTENRPHHEFALIGGQLEKVLKGKNQFLKDGLLWQNKEYLDPALYPVTWHYSSQSAYAPLYLHPEIIDEVIKYVYLPDGLTAAYRKHAADIKSGKTSPP
jgi:hypothetical protein